MKTTDALRVAEKHLESLSGRIFDLLHVSTPTSIDAAVNLSKVVSKLSPLIGNLIEFATVDYLNELNEFKGVGKWRRQDPGFPDAVFDGIVPQPGFEIKAWFPLATEITARFKDSQLHFSDDQTWVALMAWLPENLIYGRPKLLDVCVVSGLSVAKARDTHYHNPPGYLVLEPENTASRTRNLQQTNTNGYKFQGTPDELRAATALVSSWGPQGRTYDPHPQYQEQLRILLGRYKYRLDTNFAKIDRIVHTEIENFKKKVLSSRVLGHSVSKWSQLISGEREDLLREHLSKHLSLSENPIRQLPT